jgi:hypothetical protein
MGPVETEALRLERRDRGAQLASERGVGGWIAGLARTCIEQTAAQLGAGRQGRIWKHGKREG